MRFEIIHRTYYDYNAEVTASHHVACLTPRSLWNQRILGHTIDVLPAPQSMDRRLDYFGNEALFFSLENPYRRLEVIATSLVEVDNLQPEFSFGGPSWEYVRDLLRIPGQGPEIASALEFTCASPLIPRHQDFADYAAQSFFPGRPLFDAALDLTARIFNDFKFDPSATEVGTPLLEVLRQRSGVCQDFAQLQIACFRSLGLAARYVSGYIETLPPPGTQKLIGADASHAWVSVFCPPIGWLDLDPTNNLRPSGQHVTLAWGRDFTDVSPLRGVFVSSGQQELSVAVDVNRVP